MSTGVRLFGGLMSGTSLDGVDAAILALEGEDENTVSWELHGFYTYPYTPAERDRILAVLEAPTLRELTLLHADLGLTFAHAFTELLSQVRVDPDQVTAIGSHGQTIWHEPPRGEAGGEGRHPRGATLQIGNPATLAEALGCPVVSDFRSRDMAAGGEGAPLVPWCDWVLLRRPGVGRALQNLGGMGNVTFLPRSGGVEEVLGFDTGPGVALIDGAARLASGGRARWDEDGMRARRGLVIEDLLDELMADPFFRRPPPRSTGRESFGDERLSALMERLGPATDAEWDDLLATLTRLTARAIGGAYRDFLPRGGVDEVVLTGGGARNRTLAEWIAEELDPLPVRTGDEALGIDPDAREAAAFALLAWAHLHSIPANLPAVTGAHARRVLGSLTPGGGVR